MDTQVKPEVGMGVTEAVGSDSYPYTVIEVVSNREIVVQADSYKPDLDNKYDYYANQIYNYYPNPEGAKYTLTLRKNNRWKRKGDSMSATSRWYMDYRRHYSDPSF